MRTLVIHMGGIGDLLLACPSIQSLSQEGPIILAGYPERLQLVVDAGWAEEALSLDAIGFESVFTQPNERFCARVSNVDRVVVWMRDEDGRVQKTIASVTEAVVQVFAPLPPEGYTDHASEYYSACLGHVKPSSFRLNVAKGNTQYDVVIHPGSGGLKKNWPLENFEALAEALEKTGRSITWCLGPAEMESMSRLPRGPRLVCDSLSDLAIELSAARCFIGNDSGISHLSAILGIRTIALFSVTDARVWGPRGDHVTILQQHGVSMEEIVGALG